MITFRKGKVGLHISQHRFWPLAVLGILTVAVTGCSREQQDWRSAEGTDSIEAYNQFLTRHPDSELATQARTRVAQLMEDRDWQLAGSADTADAYRQFLTQHPNGKWAQEARIRIENFSLGGAVPNESPATPGKAATPASEASRMSSSGSAVTATHAANAAKSAATPGIGGGVLQPGEAAAAVGPPAPAPVASSPSATPVPTVRPAPSATSVSSASSISTRVATVTSGYGIQLGAFKSEDSAQNEWRQLTARFGPQLKGLVPHIVEANTPSGRLFRLQAPVADEPRARALCSQLKQQSQPCVPVIPH